MSRLGETELIARYFRPLAHAPGAASLTDDAATIVAGDGPELVVTTDALVAGVHFFPEDPADAVARKALRVNLSDLAAKGARPAGYLVTLALPDDFEADWLEGFVEGLALDQEEFSVSLLGGDTVRTPGPLMISVTALGHAQEGRVPRRSGGTPGQRLYVTGTIGDAALGLSLLTGAPWGASLSEADRAFLADRYRRPRPRLALAAALRAHASAAMDVSDGLAGDLAKLLRASGVTGTLDLDRIPLSPAAKAALSPPVLASAANEPGPAAQAAPGSLRRSAPGDDAPARSLLDLVAGGGDDYEILFTLPPDRQEAMTREAAAIGLAVTVVGEVKAGTEAPTFRLNGSAYALAAPSFQHFAGTPPDRGLEGR